MAAASLFKHVSLTFASLIFIQSVVWGVLSILAILCIHGYLEFDKHLEGLPKKFTGYIYSLYLDSEENDSSHRVFPNEYFIYIFWAYFLFSVLLVFTSATHIILLAQDAKRNKVNYSTIFILIFVFASCLYDAIAAIIFGLDYVKLKNSNTIPSPLEHEYVLSVPIFMATLAAKGYVLWLGNLILAITISVMLSRKIDKEAHLEPDPHIFSRTNSAYDAFGDSVFSRTEISPQRQMTEVSPRQMNSNPYATPVNSNTDDGSDITCTWARIPRKCQRNQSQFVEPYDVMTTRSSRLEDFEPMQQQYATPFATSQIAQLAEPEPDYSPTPVRRMGRNSSYPAVSSTDDVNHFYATR